MAKCGQKCEVYSRIVGYYRPLDDWNIGKRQEFKERLVYRIDNGTLEKKENGNDDTEVDAGATAGA